MEYNCGIGILCCFYVAAIKMYPASSQCCVPVVDGVSHAVLLWHPLGKPSELFSTTPYIAFDNDRLKAAATGVRLPSTSAVNTSVIIDFAAGWIYVFQPELGTCQRVQLPFGFSSTCIPFDALPLGRVLLGYDSTLKKLEIERFQIDGTMAGLDMQFEMAVTPNDCVPHSFRIWGDAHTAYVIGAVNFLNMSKGIGHEDVFTVPRYCPNVSLLDGL